MTTLTPLSITISTWTCHKNPNLSPRSNFLPKLSLPIKLHSPKCTKIGAVGQNSLRLQLCPYSKKGFLHGLSTHAGGVSWGEAIKLRQQKRVLLVRSNRGLDFNGGNGGGGDKRDDGTTTRVLGNLALAVGLTYLTMTGNLGWVLDTIVSLWLLAVIIPVVGIVAFLWWAGKDMIEGICPNCGNAFQVLKSSLNDETPLCPYCSQPFSVEGNEFVKEPISFSSMRSASSTPFGQSFDDFSPWSKKESGFGVHQLSRILGIYMVDAIGKVSQRNKLFAGCSLAFEAMIDRKLLNLDKPKAHEQGGFPITVDIFQFKKNSINEWIDALHAQEEFFKCTSFPPLKISKPSQTLHLKKPMVKPTPQFSIDSKVSQFFSDIEGGKNASASVVDVEAEVKDSE